jgi:hypothetical protein
MRARRLAAASAVLMLAGGSALALRAAPTASAAVFDAAAQTATGAAESPLTLAMRDELKRSMSDLRLKDQPSPYYIEYEIEDRAVTRVTARLGTILDDLSSRSRSLRVEVRVGDYNFDSSLFNAPGRGGGGSNLLPLFSDGTFVVPLDDDYDSVRREIWLATDAAYKRALSTFARKKAAFQNRAAGDVVPDFSRENPIETVLPGLAPAVMNRDWPGRARQLSAVFLDGGPVLDNSDVLVTDTRGSRYFLNSEGFRTVVPVQLASIRVSAETRAEDGGTIRDVFTLVENKLEDLPPMNELMQRTRELAKRVRATRNAKVGEEFTGPVLLEGQASAEVVAQALVPAVLARRAPENAGGRGGQQAQPTPFLRRIGLRVLAEPFSASDTPSVTQYEGKPVPGAYVVDDNGIRVKDVKLIEKGRLLTLLTGRTPLKGLLQSNGHRRGGDIQPGVFQLQSTEAVSAANLRDTYLDFLKMQDKPFGYIVRHVGAAGEFPGGGPSLGPVITEIVRVTPDGDEEPVRGLRFGQIAPAAFRDLLDASKERTLHSYRVGSTEAATVIVPNLIFEELEIQRNREIVQKPPIVGAPNGSQ